MAKSGLCIAAFCVAFVFAMGAEAQQTKKKNPQCVPNFLEACQKRCVSAGGLVAGCPNYCLTRKRDLGCQ